MDIDRLILDIKNDKSSGASELAIKAIGCLSQYSERYNADDTKTYIKSMVGVGRQLIGAQPSMAPLFSGVNKILIELERGIKSGYSIPQLREVVQTTAEEITGHQKKALSYIQSYVLDLIQDGQIILIHSYSSTVINSLVFAHQKGKKFQVIVTESRPLFEGRRTANILVENGIEVSLIADMAAFHFMDNIDMVVVGCDCICSKGVVNKTGTKGLAMASSCQDIPFYVVCEKSKFLPSNYLDEPGNEEEEPNEILEEAGDIKISNFYFDLTPYQYINGIVTEDGLMGTNEVRNVLTSLPVCEDLLKM